MIVYGEKKSGDCPPVKELTVLPMIFEHGVAKFIEKVLPRSISRLIAPWKKKKKKSIQTDRENISGVHRKWRARATLTFPHPRSSAQEQEKKKRRRRGELERVSPTFLIKRPGYLARVRSFIRLIARLDRARSRRKRRMTGTRSGGESHVTSDSPC